MKPHQSLVLADRKRDIAHKDTRKFCFTGNALRAYYKLSLISTHLCNNGVCHPPTEWADIK